MKRIEQYQKKLDIITEKLNNLPDSPGKISQSHQSVIETSMDIINLLCEDLGVKKNDLYSNLDELIRLNIFSPDFVKDLRQLNAMRYLLGNQITNFQDNLVAAQIEVVQKILNEFVLKIDEIIHERLSHIE
ncbi:MAG: hypothetical protein GF311_15860 [Candidatus Lokiarchaeota archaeon]|nr:hypothetical protein [Candidatus Lokiarchaeota archaeon]